MRRDPEFFGEKPVSLIYIGKKLSESLAVEKVFEGAEIDYLVEVDYYTGGIIFRGERAGAFFYVDQETREKAAAVLIAAGYKPQEVQ